MQKELDWRGQPPLCCCCCCCYCCCCQVYFLCPLSLPAFPRPRSFITAFPERGGGGGKMRENAWRPKFLLLVGQEIKQPFFFFLKKTPHFVCVSELRHLEDYLNLATNPGRLPINSYLPSTFISLPLLQPLEPEPN